MRWPDAAEITDVTARDGLQSLARTYPVEVRVALISILREAGVVDFEVGSFVRPDLVPQLARTDEVLRRLPSDDGCRYRVLVPNLRGAELALAAGARDIVAMSVASDTYSARNTRMSVAEALEALRCVATLCVEEGASIAVGIGLAMFCPYEGPVPVDRVLGMIDRVADIGVSEFTLAASVGVETPREVAALCEQVRSRFPLLNFGMHIHNMNGLALANTLAAMDVGVTRFESVTCGIGGGIAMPESMHGYGNVPTEDLVTLLAGDGVHTGIDPGAIVTAARDIVTLLGLPQSYGHASGGSTRAELQGQIATSGGGPVAPVAARGEG